MKKRILALALAGTTAFSVFGAAISANAEFVWDSNTNSWVWDNDSTHTEFRNDEYVSYRDVVGVADSITVTYTAAATQKQYLDKNNAAGLAAGWQNYNTEADITTHIYDQGVKEAFSNVALINLWGIWVHPTTGKIANFTGNTVTYDDATTTNAAAAITGGNIVAVEGGYTVQVTGTAQAVYKPTLEEALLEAAKQYNEQNPGNPATTAYVSTNNTQVQKNAYDALTPYQTYYNNMEFRTIAGIPAAATGNVQVNGQNAFGVNASGDRTLNWDFDASTSVSDTPISLTEVVTGTNGNSIVTTSVPTRTIFAYDYVPANQFDSTAAAISDVWYDADASATDVAAAIGVNTVGGVYNAERGDGSTTYGVRASVVADWVDFLNELGINHDNGYDESFEEFYENYEEIWEREPIYDPNTGLVVEDVEAWVDLYNLDALLRDIFELSAEDFAIVLENRTTGGFVVTGWSNANTSEMVYLMQQYDKYFDDYIQREEVATSEWGEFLLEMLNAATADDFRNNTEYVRYINRVENLEAAYEAATTVNMIREAEEGMYDLLTELNGGFRASGSVDTATLDNTLEGLFFNVGDVPATYRTALSTTSTNVDYRTYEYFVAVANRNSANEWTFTTTLTPGYYSLYPMLDYIDNDRSSPNEVFNGNSAPAINTTAGIVDDYSDELATEEYEWFWNVYQLAVNMFDDNTKQGSIDAINAALQDAVDALVPTTTPFATETSAMEEMMDEYAGKIDTDYDEGFYNKYEQAYDYAENSAEGKWQTRIARNIVGVAGEALTYQGTQLTVTKNMINDLKDAIDSGETALEAIRNSSDYNAAQVNALNRAIDDAQYLVDLYNGDAELRATNNEEERQSVNHVYTAKVGDKDQMVISDIDNAIEAIDDAINYSEIVMGWSKNEAGKWMYGTEEGYLSNGWNQVDGGKTWFYFNEDGTAKQSEWWNDNGTWYWFNSNCGAATGWAKVDGEWYFFKGNNAMKTGWEKVDGNWYYMASSGKMVTGWCEIGGKWYYFSKESNSLGQMLYSTTVDGYKLDANGVWVK